MPSTTKKSKEEEFSLIPREKLLALYAALLRSTMLERTVRENWTSLRSNLRTSPAAAAAVCIDLKPGEYMAAVARDFLPPFVEGRSLGLILSALRTPTSAQRARFAAQVRAAMATARRNRSNGNRKVVAIFGRPATGRQWQTMLRDANNERLPIIFVCNGQSRRRSLRPPRFLPAITVDRDDVVALYRVVSEGMAHARRGNGPTLIECIPWKPLVKAEPGDAIGKLEAYLAQTGISPARRKAAVIAELEAELARRVANSKH